MQWLLDNWIIVLLIGGMIGMHLFGHGGHGGGKHKHRDPEKPGDTAHNEVADTVQPDDHKDKVRTEHVDPAG